MQTRMVSLLVASRAFTQLRCYAQTAYAAYVKEAYKTAQIQKLQSKERFAAIGKLWQQLPKNVKEQWEQYAAKLSKAQPAAVKKAAKARSPARAKPKTKATAAKKASPKKRAAGKPKSKAAIPATTKPTKPAKARSAFQIFQKAASKRPEVAGLPFTQRQGAIAKMWKGLSEAEKKPYAEQVLASQPARPRKSTSAYTLFTRKAYTQAEIKALPFEQRLKRIAELWKAMPEKDKASFREEAGRLKPVRVTKVINSPYSRFVKATYSRADIQALPADQRFKKIGELWKALSPQEKQPYLQTASAAPSQPAAGTTPKA